MEQLVAFSIGPVQSFIASARKTTDLWSGSYILSELTQKAMTLVEEIFGAHSVEWIQPQPMKAEVLDNREIASFPNRFICIVSSPLAETKEKLHRVETGLTEYLAEVARASVGLLFAGKVLPASVWKQVEEQVSDFLEIFWAFVPFENRGGFHEKRLEVESMLASVKNNRPVSFQQQHGLVCTVCKQREALSAESPTAEMSQGELKADLRKLWGNIRNDVSRSQDGEHLCAVCSTKRMRRKALQFEPFPSVTAFTMAKIKPEQLDEGGDPLGMTASGDQERYYAVVMFDGDDMGKWVSGAKSPTKKATIEGNKAITERLSKFSTAGIAQAKGKKNMKVIYSGGDDVLAIGSILDVMRFVEEVRDMFSDPENGLDKDATGSCGIIIAPEKAPLQQVISYGRKAEALAKGYENAATGAVKDAFTLHFLRGSGQQRIVTLPFSTRMPNQAPAWFNLPDKKLISWILGLADVWQELGLSPNFIYHFEDVFKHVAMEWNFKQSKNKTAQSENEGYMPFQNRAEIEMIRSELYRLIGNATAKSAPETKGKIREFADQLSSLYFIHQGDFLSYTQLLEMIRYFSKLAPAEEVLENVQTSYV